MNANLDLGPTLRREIRRLILLFIVGLVGSGVTTFPLAWEIKIVRDLLEEWGFNNSLSRWINLIHGGLQMTNSQYPFLSYGTDWLGFAHLIIAIVFIGPWRDPVKNKWVIEFGIIACILIFPLALIAGEVRGIPMYWRIIDCMFGVVGGLILVRCYRRIRQFELLMSYENKH